MKKEPAIAVVIPTYKARNHILGVIEAIGPEVNAIYVVDDCCPDNTGDYVVYAGLGAISAFRLQDRVHLFFILSFCMASVVCFSKANRSRQLVLWRGGRGLCRLGMGE